MSRPARATAGALALSVPLLLTAASAEAPAPGAASCLACHEAGARPAAEGAPPDLGSLSAKAIEEALAAYRGGARDGTVMPRIAKGFSAAEARAIARALGRAAADR